MTQTNPRALGTLTIATDGPVATVTLNRPERLNIMNLAMRDDLFECFSGLTRDDGIRAIVVTGAGEAFCAGGDANDFFDLTQQEFYDLIAKRSHRWFEALWRCPKPVIAAVNGIAAGGGSNLALACDILIASERARFGETFVRIGLMPDLGGLFLLPRAVGLHRAKEMAFTGEVLDAQQALAAGIFSRVVPHERLIDEAMSLARRLADGPHRVHALTKAVLNRSFESAMEEVLQYELLAQPVLFGTPDHREALNAFMEKRKPQLGHE